MVRQADNQENTEVMNFKCDPEFKRNVRVSAAQSGKSMSEWIREELRESFDGTTNGDK